MNITKEDLANDYDWCAAFEFTGWRQEADADGWERERTGGNARRSRPCWCVSDKRTDDIAPFGPPDVAEVIAASEGESDGANWLLVGRLENGAFFFLDAGCDYTGWDCQSGGTATVSTSLESLIAFALDDDQRERLSLEVAA
jgi:hypothetical protein